MNKKKELTFPLIGIIYNFKGIMETNHLYTVEEMRERDTKLLYAILHAKPEEFIQSDMSTSNKTISGFMISDRKILYDFLRGKYNDNYHEDDKEWYWENSKLDIYNESLVYSYTMEQALSEFNNRVNNTLMITISTAHICKKTSEWLSDQCSLSDSLLSVYDKSGYGFFIYLPEDISDKHTIEEIPEDLIKCFKFAQENNAECLCLDCDGPVMKYENLDIYNW